MGTFPSGVESCGKLYNLKLWTMAVTAHTFGAGLELTNSLLIHT